jgi:uncharacterized RDD family membrane protein YckC
LTFRSSVSAAKQVTNHKELVMESPAQGRPNRETGLPPGVEVGPLGKRFVAYLINLSVPVLVSLALISLLPGTRGGLRMTLSVIGALIVIGWLVFVWYTLAVRAASPGLRAMKLQVVGFLDGRPIGPSRVFLRAVVFWALFLTGIGLLLMLIMMLRHPRQQGWHDLAVTSVMIKERLLAPPIQPARAVAGAQQGPAAEARSQPQPSSVRPGSPSSYTPGEGYSPAGNAAPPSPGMAPAGSGAPYATAVPPSGSGAPYATAVPPSGSAASYGSSAYAAPPQSAPSGPPSYGSSPYGSSPYESSPTSPPSSGGISSSGQQPVEPISLVSQGSQPGASPGYEEMPVFASSPGDSADQSANGSASRYDQDWSILLDDGRRIAVEGLVLLGRNPQPKAGEEDAQLIKIADETRTVSKSHLAVGVDDGGIYIVDRGSTNGSTVSTTNGMSSRCRAGEMVRVGDGAIVSIGDHWLEITRGS